MVRGYRSLQGSSFAHLLTDPFKFCERIVLEGIDCHDNRDTMGLHIRNMLLQIGKSSNECFLVRSGKPDWKWGARLYGSPVSVQLECAQRCHNDCRSRLESGNAALHVKEFLRTQVTSKSCFSYDIVGATQGHRI